MNLHRNEKYLLKNILKIFILLIIRHLIMLTNIRN